MVGCGLACPGGGGAGCRGASSGGRGGGGTVGDRIRGLGVSGRGGGGGGSWKNPYHMGGGGGSNTEHGTIYTYIHMCIDSHTHMYSHVWIHDMYGSPQGGRPASIAKRGSESLRLGARRATPAVPCGARFRGLWGSLWVPFGRVNWLRDRTFCGKNADLGRFGAISGRLSCNETL